MNAALREVLGWITILAVAFAILTYFFVMALAVDLVAATSLGGELAAFSLQGLPPIGAFFFYFRLSSTLISINLLAYVIFCMVIFVACFIAAFRSRGGLLSSLRNLPRNGRVTRSSNWMLTMPLVSSGLLVTVFIATELLTIAGVSSGALCNPGIDCPPPARLFAGLAHAPIGEELAYRILTPLGLIVPIRIIWRKIATGQGPSKSKLLSLIGLSLLSPESAKSSAGYPSFASNGWRSIHWLEWTFVAVSSALFGIAHILPGGGTDWEIGKAVTAAISGAALAIVYVTYGAYATILLHWFFDFYTGVLIIGLPISGGPTNIAIDGIIFLGQFAIGTLSIAIGIAWLGKKLVERRRPTAYKPADAPAGRDQ